MFLTTFLVLVLLNGILAMAEASVVSARKSRLQKAADEGSTKARWALRLATKPNRFLGAVQIGITFLGILTGALAEATLAPDVEAWLRPFPIIGEFARTLSLALI